MSASFCRPWGPTFTHDWSATLTITRAATGSSTSKRVSACYSRARVSFLRSSWPRRLSRCCTAVVSQNRSKCCRWICLGTAIHVISWPMGYVIVAKDPLQKNLFAARRTSWTVVNISLSWFLVSSHGVRGAGMAFFGSYVFHVLLIFPIVRHMTGFAWSKENVRTALVGLQGVASWPFSGLHPQSPPPWAFCCSS